MAASSIPEKPPSDSLSSDITYHLNCHYSGHVLHKMFSLLSLSNSSYPKNTCKMHVKSSMYNQPNFHTSNMGILPYWLCAREHLKILAWLQGIYIQVFAVACKIKWENPEKWEIVVLKRGRMHVSAIFSGLDCTLSGSGRVFSEYFQMCVTTQLNPVFVKLNKYSHPLVVGQKRYVYLFDLFMYELAPVHSIPYWWLWHFQDVKQVSSCTKMRVWECMIFPLLSTLISCLCIRQALL